MSELQSISPSLSVPARRPRGTFAQLLMRAVRRWQRRRALDTFSLLDDGSLTDIGISRNDIPRVVDGLIRAVDAEPLSKVDWWDECAPNAPVPYVRAA